MQEIIYDNGFNLFRIFVTSVFGYLGLIVMLRMSGTRTLSKMNSFDFVITIALGSVFATGILQKTVPLVDTLFAIAMLVSLQFSVTYLAVRFKKVDTLITAAPVLLFAEGKYLRDSMLRARVTQDEVQAAVREQGFSSIDQIRFVVLESNGNIVAIRS